jgi:hypothetical protein
MKTDPLPSLQRFGLKCGNALSVTFSTDDPIIPINITTFARPCLHLISTHLFPLCDRAMRVLLTLLALLHPSLAQHETLSPILVPGGQAPIIPTQNIHDFVRGPLKMGVYPTNAFRSLSDTSSTMEHTSTRTFIGG